MLHHFRDWPTDEATPAHAALASQHERSLRLYRKKYAGFGERDGLWRWKRQLWAWLRRRLGRRYDENSLRPRLGGLWRDWNNAFLARHISPIDPWLSMGRDFHLRQSVRRRPLPEDPKPEGA